MLILAATRIFFVGMLPMLLQTIAVVISAVANALHGVIAPTEFRFFLIVFGDRIGIEAPYIVLPVELAVVACVLSTAALIRQRGGDHISDHLLTIMLGIMTPLVSFAVANLLLYNANLLLEEMASDLERFFAYSWSLDISDTAGRLVVLASMIIPYSTVLVIAVAWGQAGVYWMIAGMYVFRLAVAFATLVVAIDFVFSLMRGLLSLNLSRAMGALGKLTLYLVILVVAVASVGTEASIVEQSVVAQLAIAYHYADVPVLGYLVENMIAPWEGIIGNQIDYIRGQPPDRCVVSDTGEVTEQCSDLLSLLMVNLFSGLAIVALQVFLVWRASLFLWQGIRNLHHEVFVG